MCLRSLSFVVYWSWFVVCCFVQVDRCVLVGVWRAFVVACCCLGCCMLYVVCWFLFVVRSVDDYCLLRVVRKLSFVVSVFWCSVARCLLLFVVMYCLGCLLLVCCLL